MRFFQRWVVRAVCEHDRQGLGRPPVSFRRAAASVLRGVSVLLPNSQAERREIERCFGIGLPCVVVPNAADAETFGPATNHRSFEREGVLCVGRIEPRKNQLNLILALRSTGIGLTLVGQAGRFSQRYFRRCVRQAGGEVRFVGQQLPAQLGEMYRQAQVHACVSWYETPGLVNLEAALCGCAIVATTGGCTREYLGDQAHYCQADCPESIREAVETAMARGPAPGLATRVARDYTWDAAAEKTLEAYYLALAYRQ